jgi:hypothetical protein
MFFTRKPIAFMKAARTKQDIVWSEQQGYIIASSIRGISLGGSRGLGSIGFLNKEAQYVDQRNWESERI